MRKLVAVLVIALVALAFTISPHAHQHQCPCDLAPLITYEPEVVPFLWLPPPEPGTRTDGEPNHVVPNSRGPPWPACSDPYDETSLKSRLVACGFMR